MLFQHIILNLCISRLTLSRSQIQLIQFYLNLDYIIRLLLGQKQTVSTVRCFRSVFALCARQSRTAIAWTAHPLYSLTRRFCSHFVRQNNCVSKLKLRFCLFSLRVHMSQHAPYLETYLHNKSFSPHSLAPKILEDHVQGSLVCMKCKSCSLRRNQ